MHALSVVNKYITMGINLTKSNFLMRHWILALFMGLQDLTHT